METSSITEILSQTDAALLFRKSTFTPIKLINLGDLNHTNNFKNYILIMDAKKFHKMFIFHQEN